MEVYYRVSGEEQRKLDELNLIPFNTSYEEDTPVAKSENAVILKNTNIVLQHYRI